jgi:hypothetical protein
LITAIIWYAFPSQSRGSQLAASSPTITEKSCKKRGMVFEQEKKKCVEASRGMFDDDTFSLSAAICL